MLNFKKMFSDVGEINRGDKEISRGKKAEKKRPKKKSSKSRTLTLYKTQNIKGILLVN